MKNLMILRWGGSIFLITLLLSFVLTLLMASKSFIDVLVYPGNFSDMLLSVILFSILFTGIVVLAIAIKRLKAVVIGVVFSFLYLPMVILIIYSFNSSRLVTIWAGFSTEWYHELLHNRALIEAVLLSFCIAIAAATTSVVLGLLASFVLVRFRHYRGGNLFSFMITAPLVMPEVITGLSLLLLFVAMAQLISWPNDRGALTIWLAHVTFCTAYVTVVISARLRELDKSLEEAAMDLGANPVKVFFVITLPMIASSLVSGWLLAFTLSLDDLVISSFVTGPGATTLPMLIFSKVRLGVDPQINALATIIILTVSMIGLISWLLVRNAERRQLHQLSK